MTDPDIYAIMKIFGGFYCKGLTIKKGRWPHTTVKTGTVTCYSCGNKSRLKGSSIPEVCVHCGQPFVPLLDARKCRKDGYDVSVLQIKMKAVVDDRERILGSPDFQVRSTKQKREKRDGGESG